MRFLPVLLCLVVGCGYGPALHPASGTVSLPDGKPAAGCVVEFSSESPDTKGMNARGVEQPDGTFMLSTRVGSEEKPGAVVGSHKAVIVAPALGGSGMPAAVNVSLVPEKYGDYWTPKLTFDIKPGANTFTIKLEK